MLVYTSAMSAASHTFEVFFRLIGASKDLSDASFYKKLRRSAVAYRHPSGAPRFLGVKTESGVYCGMRYYTFVPRHVDTDRSVIYLHGSGYMNAYRRVQSSFAAHLAVKNHCKVYFPLYPKLPCVVAISCFALLNNFVAFLQKKGEVLLVGDSSGGALALSLASERERIKTVIAISPWVSLCVSEEGRAISGDVMLSLSTLDKAAQLWRGELPFDSVKVSPISGNYAGKDLLIFGGGKEILLPDIRTFCHTAAEQGASITFYERKDQQHCYPLMPTPEGREAKEIICQKIRSWLYGERV